MDAKWVLRGLLGVVLIVALAAGCAPAPAGSAEEMLVEKDAGGGTVTLSVGQTLAVRLESNPTTGYGWHIIEVDEAILQSQGDPEYTQQETQDQQMVGVGGWEVLRFTALKSGTTTLKLGYSRSFEPDVAPIEEFTLTITVK